MTTLTLPTKSSRPSATSRVATEVRCSHCRLPVPAGLLKPDEHEQFCCEGCRTVYAMIRSCGLGDYYTLRERDGLAAAVKPAAPSGKRYEEFDDPTFEALYCTPAASAAGELRQVEFYLENVHCGACVWLIERLPHVVPAVKESRLDFGKHVVRLTWDANAVKLSEIACRLAGLGYPPHPAKGRAQRELRRQEDRTHLIRIAIAGAIAGNMMIISFALYGSMFHGMEAAYQRLFHWTSLALMAVSVFGPGRVFFRGAVAALRAGTMHMDVPVAIGLAAGSIWSAVNVVRGSSEVYFDSLAILVFLLLLGRWIQLRQQRRSHDAVELLFSMTPSSARLVEGESHDDAAIIRETPIQALRPGQIVEVRAGDSVPVDGVIVQGYSMLDGSLMTGEPKPMPIGVGERVHAGTVNLASMIRVRVEATGEATRVGQLMRLVQDCATRRAPVVKLADRIAGVFVAVILMLALLTFGVWIWIEPTKAVPNAMALLIITCPCALGLATPLAIIAGIGRAAGQGMLIRGGEVVEQLNRPGIVLLDKTGTITQGSMAVTDWQGPEDLKPIVGAIESHSSHPLARALQAAFVCEAGAPAVLQVVENAGMGIEAIANQRRVRIGSRRFMALHEIEIPQWILDAEQSLAARAITPILIAIDNRVEAIAGVGDPIKPDAKASIAALRQAGWDVGILSGDHETVVAAVAQQVGIDPAKCRGRVSPEEKLACVQQMLQRQPVMMVGDGVNDAAALAAASVGVAVKGGAEASFAAADVYLNRPGLAPLAELVQGASRTFSVIRRNIAASLIYNIVGVSLAVTGLINPLVAAIIMPLSSLTVITLSYRSRTF